ncbi:MAG: AlwI family type II restriction endonuclease [Patescibacteria group bacterium]|nr:AlwI family type II restriction endonuclease [Patescibacteria group bacterium]
MKKPWSISTTVRNPDRLRDFLRVLKELEGQPFNSENQIKYQILLIQNRFYKPTNLTREQQEYFDDIETEMPFSVAKEIFNVQGYEDPAMRGRNSVAPLNKMGLCIAKNSVEGVKITPLGEYLLSENYDLGKLFFIHFLKWQLPNPASTTFSENDGFAIKPFIGALHLINEVNKRWVKLGNNPIGISKDEFSLFAPTLIDYKNIKKQAEKLIEYRVGLRSQKDDKRRKQFKKKFGNNFSKTFLRTNKGSEIKKLLNNLKDYGDNAIRYFRLTRYLHIRGGGFYVNLEPRRSIEIDKLLSTDNAAPLAYENADKYIEYLADIEQPVLPWETKSELGKIAEKLSRDVQEYVIDLKSKIITAPPFHFKKIESLIEDQLKEYIEQLRGYRRKLQELETHFESQDVAKIQEYINALRGIYQSDNKKSIELERLSTLALNALNDALEIKPNYPVGDDNEPTFTAPANKPDIECFYEQFNSVCEVTMLTNRSQWYNEGQPVMRHVRDFEESHTDKTAYCLFIAPRLHQDTVETFWMAIKYGYKGTAQKIVPLSIAQFVRLLESLLEIRKQGKRFTHDELLNLYEQILSLTNRVAHSEKWIEQIPETITEWQKSILAKQ